MRKHCMHHMTYMNVHLQLEKLWFQLEIQCPVYLYDCRCQRSLLRNKINIL